MRLVFAFGTLYDDEIIKSLLGVIPRNFYTSLPGYALYRGTYAQIPAAVRSRLSHLNEETFSYLYIRPTPQNRVTGRVYEIDLAQELILDHWELYPDWYRKQPVKVQAGTGELEAFVYTLDHDGERVMEVTRVLNDPTEVTGHARAARARVQNKFPQAFSD
jgi:gamma-glutamylcyclotransferase (GGCT)/AIG2-like uncharacterized protein YtfP